VNLGGKAMLGTIINAIAIIVGSLIGIFMRKGISNRYKKIIMQGIPLCIIIIGISNALKSNDLMVMILSVVIGSIIGETLNIELRLEHLGEYLKSKFKNSNGNFTEGFITSSLIYCVGAMAIMGAIESGLTGRYDTLMAKSILDGISSVIFASTFGIGVMFSAGSVLVYQGAITLFASSLSKLISEVMVTELSAVGGVLIIGLAFNVLGVTEEKIKVGNMLPAIFLPVIYYAIIG
jgi:uncharacterized membrane protein YqgA involved in biofilm formation